MDYDVFMSYTSGDNAIAMRIYNDLIRSGLKVWRYEKDGLIGKDFIMEINEMIQNSDSFVLIDSYRARESGYVKEECEIGHNLYVDEIGNIDKFIVCLVEDERTTFKKKELFINQNRIRYINFSGYNYWDNNEIYLKSIESLCKVFNKEYKSSPLSIPSYRDFEKELASTKISFPGAKGENISEKEVILSDFRNFLYRYRQNAPNSKRRIEFVIEALELLGIKLTTPHLSLGIIQSDLNEFVEAFTTFKQVTKDFPEDPRGYASGGAMLFKLQKYDEALESYEKAIEIAGIHKDNKYIQDHFIELVYNKIQVMIRMGKFEEAKKEIEMLNQGQRALPEIKIARILIHIFQGDVIKTKELYDQLQKFYTPDMVIQNSSDLNYIFGDLEFQLGKLLAGSDNYEEAIKHYEYSTKYSPRCIRHKAELAQLYHALHKLRKQADIIANGLKLHPNTDIETYFYGFLHYLASNYDEAKRYYDLSKMELKGWMFYDRLIH